jgi:hypothetical protein
MVRGLAATIRDVDEGDCVSVRKALVTVGVPDHDKTHQVAVLPFDCNVG